MTLLLANRAGASRRPAGPIPTRSACGCRGYPSRLRRSGRSVPVMQSSANLSGEPDARTLAEVPQSLREGADLVIDGGELPGVASTVLDLRDWDEHRRWFVLREGALASTAVEEALRARAPLSASLVGAAATGALRWKRPPGSGQPTRRAPGHRVDTACQGERRERAEPRLLQPPARRGGPRDRRRRCAASSSASRARSR